MSCKYCSKSLEEQIQELSLTMKKSLAYNRSTSEEGLIILAKDPSKFVREGVAQNLSATSKVLSVLAKSPEENIRVDVANHPNLSVEDFKLLATDPSRKVKRYLASNRNVTQDALEIMSKDSDARVRQAVADSNFVSVDVLTNLLEVEEDRDVLEELASNRVIKHISQDKLMKLLELATEGNNYRLKLNLAANPHTPSAFLEVITHSYLKKDDDINIAELLAENPNSTAYVLEQLLSKFKEKDIYINISARKDLDSHLLNILLKNINSGKVSDFVPASIERFFRRLLENHEDADQKLKNVIRENLPEKFIYKHHLEKYYKNLLTTEDLINIKDGKLENHHKTNIKNTEGLDEQYFKSLKLAEHIEQTAKETEELFRKVYKGVELKEPVETSGHGIDSEESKNLRGALKIAKENDFEIVNRYKVPEIKDKQEFINEVLNKNYLPLIKKLYIGLNILINAAHSNGTVIGHRSYIPVIDKALHFYENNEVTEYLHELSQLGSKFNNRGRIKSDNQLQEEAQFIYKAKQKVRNMLSKINNKQSGKLINLQGLDIKLANICIKSLKELVEDKYSPTWYYASFSKAWLKKIQEELQINSSVITIQELCSFLNIANILTKPSANDLFMRVKIEFLPQESSALGDFTYYLKKIQIYLVSILYYQLSDKERFLRNKGDSWDYNKIYSNILSVFSHELRHAADWAYQETGKISEFGTPNMGDSFYYNRPTELKSYAGELAIRLLNKYKNKKTLLPFTYDKFKKLIRFIDYKEIYKHILPENKKIFLTYFYNEIQELLKKENLNV